MNLTPDQLRQIFPGLSRAKCAAYAPPFNAALTWGRINTRARLCAFVAQLGHESQDLKFLREIWGPTPAQNRYDVREDLGNTPERDGDGKKYMGRGGLQRTGLHNYRRFQEATGLPVLLHPELLEKPEHAFESDVLFWTDNKLNALADKLTLRGDAADLKQFDKITRAINGGYNGRVDRQRRYLVALASLPTDLFEPKPLPHGTSSPIGETIAPPSDTKPAADETRGQSILLEKLTSYPGAKTAGLSILKRLGRPAGLLFAALQAGNVYAWLGVIILVAGAAWILYVERHAISAGAGALLQKFTARN